MTRTLRQAALFSLLAICLAGIASPRVVRAQGSEPAAKEETPERPHELLYRIINFAILVGGLGYLLRKPAAEFFSTRSADIQKSLDEGRKALEASQAQLAAVEAKLRGLEAEIAAFKASARREMEADRQRMQQAAAEEAARILGSSAATVRSQISTARVKVRHYCERVMERAK